MDHDGVYIIGNEKDDRLGKSRRDRSPRRARSRSPMKTKSLLDNRRSRSPAKPQRNNMRTMSPTKRRIWETRNSGMDGNPKEMEEGGTAIQSSGAFHRSNLEEDNTGSGKDRQKERSSASPSQRMNWKPASNQVASSSNKVREQRQETSDEIANQVDIERDPSEKNESSAFRLFSQFFYPVKKSAPASSKATETICTKSVLTHNKAETETICVDTAKEILANRTSVKVFEPSLKNNKKKKDSKMKADSSTETPPGGNGANATRRRQVAMQPRQELTKISKQDLQRWLDFAINEINAAMVQPSVDCGSSITSLGDTVQEAEKTIPEEVAAVNNNDEAAAFQDVGPFCGGVFGLSPNPPPNNNESVVQPTKDPPEVTPAQQVKSVQAPISENKQFLFPFKIECSP